MTSKLLYHFVGNQRGETDNNQLKIHKLTKLDKGKDISCRYTDEYGEVSNMSGTITLDPYYGIENVVLEPEYTTINVTEGTILGPINCTANCNLECTYKWKHRGKTKGKKFELVFSMQALTISDIKKSQTGIYRCRIDHPYTDAYERRDISVNVQYCPKIKEIWFDDTSQRYRLSTPITFNFSEDILESNKANGYIDIRSKLPSFKCEDSGEFTIRAINGIAHGDTRKVNLTILCEPRNVTTESRKIETKVDTTENIVMYVVSSPLPNVKWCRMTGFNWIVKTEIYDYRYEISSKIHVRWELDFGVYGIRICNLKGCIEDNITLKPLDKPEAPQNLFVGTITFRSVNLSWIAGFNGGYDQTFTVQFKTTDNDIWNSTTVHTNEIKTGSAIYYTLDKLSPGTSYQVMVLSTNKHGSRNASLEFKTKG
ncbi:unnamed protein product [Mytilus coruscus]|uniref:TTN n=1 Tax=Mytilus coruscus TaxID=42192 RepID=A0A6J8BC68_MYTCO|nr:unnamed protein product [Mytilus coruscus]